MMRSLSVFFIFFVSILSGVACVEESVEDVCGPSPTGRNWCERDFEVLGACTSCPSGTTCSAPGQETCISASSGDTGGACAARVSEGIECFVVRALDECMASNGIYFRDTFCNEIDCDVKTSRCWRRDPGASNSTINYNSDDNGFGD